ncbi:MAG: hypothetical protein KDE58_02800 [Caldilineaceae bacterium]|nr:hypothetical protein [Caldilineaceae bacterium]
MQQYLFRATGTILAMTYLTFVVTMHALWRLWLGIESDVATRQTIAFGLGVLVVTTPLWWLHWRWMRWLVAAAAPARRHDFRTYVLAVAVVALFAVFGSAGLGVAVLARLALGVMETSAAGWAQSLLAVTAMLGATGVWYLHWGYIVQDQPGYDVG